MLIQPNSIHHDINLNTNATTDSHISLLSFFHP